MNEHGRKKGGAFVTLQKFGPLEGRSAVAAAAAAAVLQAEGSSQQDQVVVLNMLARILSSTPQLLFWKDRAGVYLGCNEAFARVAGFKTPTEIIGKTDFDLPWPREEAEKYRVQDAEVIEQNRAKNHIAQPVWRADGTRVWFDTTKVPLHDESGQVYGVLGVAEDITERRQMEESIAHSVSLLRATLESTADGVVVVDLAGRIVNFNERFAEMWRLPKELLPARRNGCIIDSRTDRLALEFVLDQLMDPAAFLAKVNDLYAHPQESSLDTLEFKDGRVFERYSQPQTIDGQPAGRVWSFSDITKRAQAQKALQRQLAFDDLVTLLLARFASATVQEIDGCIQMTLEEVARFIGADCAFIILASEDLRTWTWKYEWTGPGVQRHTPEYQNVPLDQDGWATSKLLAGEVFELRNLSEIPPETPKIWEQFLSEGLKAALMVPLRARGGKVAGCIGLFTLGEKAIWNEEDVRRLRMVSDAMANTLERKRAEKLLRISEEKFRGIFEEAPVGIFQSTPEGKFISVNATLASMFRFDSPEQMAREVTHIAEQLFVNPDERKTIVAKALAAKAFVHQEVNYRRRDGSVFVATLYSRAVRDHADQVVFLEGFVEDITERKRAEAEIRSLNAGLEQRVEARTAELAAANQELETFAYAVSHDLRAPLRGIEGWSQVLMEECSDQLDDQARKYLAMVSSGAQRMSSLIEALLRLSRAGRGEMRPEKVNLSQIALEVAEELRRQRPNQTVRLAVAPAIVTEGDPVLLRAVVQNLLENAWKFSANQPEAQVEFGQLPQPGNAVYFIRDNGAGFDMKDANKLFVPFQRLHRKEEFSGTGVGLATVQRIIRRHGGQIWAEGEPGKGATFYFTLPQTAVFD